MDSILNKLEKILEERKVYENKLRKKNGFMRKDMPTYFMLNTKNMVFCSDKNVLLKM